MSRHLSPFEFATVFSNSSFSCHYSTLVPVLLNIDRKTPCYLVMSARSAIYASRHGLEYGSSGWRKLMMHRCHSRRLEITCQIGLHWSSTAVDLAQPSGQITHITRHLSFCQHPIVKSFQTAMSTPCQQWLSTRQVHVKRKPMVSWDMTPAKSNNRRRRRLNNLNLAMDSQVSASFYCIRKHIVCTANMIQAMHIGWWTG